jgi:hypothetical protein
MPIGKALPKMQVQTWLLPHPKPLILIIPSPMAFTLHTKHLEISSFIWGSLLFLNNPPRKKRKKKWGTTSTP